MKKKKKKREQIKNFTFNANNTGILKPATFCLALFSLNITFNS